MDASLDQRGSNVLEGNARKRQRVSRNSEIPSPVVALAKTEPDPKPASNLPTNYAHADGASCHHEESLKTVHTDLDAMRQLITCRICQRFLYEPYALACGHTFCYSCLKQWLSYTNRKTCPDCRTIIKQEPTPSYLIREMVLVFINRNELLPDGETVEEHHQHAKEEAEVVAKDKADTNGPTSGLFRGCFGRNGRAPLQAIHDPSDHVDRCPQCLNEVEDRYCNTCGVRVLLVDDTDYEFSDEDDDESFLSDELDHELDTEDAEGTHGLDGYSDGPDSIPLSDDVFERFDAARAARLRPGEIMMYDPWTGREFGSEYDDSGEEEIDPTMEGFIVDDDRSNDEEDDGAQESDTTETIYAPAYTRYRRMAPIVVSDDDDDDEVSPQQPRGAPVASRVVPTHRQPHDLHSPLTISDPSDDSEEDNVPTMRSQGIKQRRRMRQQRPTLISSDEDSESESEAPTNVGTAGGFSPIQPSVNSEVYRADEIIHPGIDYTNWNSDESEAPQSVGEPITSSDDSDDDSEIVLFRGAQQQKQQPPSNIFNDPAKPRIACEIESPLSSLGRISCTHADLTEHRRQSQTTTSSRRNHRAFQPVNQGTNGDGGVSIYDNPNFHPVHSEREPENNIGELEREAVIDFTQYLLVLISNWREEAKSSTELTGWLSLLTTFVEDFLDLCDEGMNRQDFFV